jgi:2Fe-2S ferredoxin
MPRIIVLPNEALCPEGDVIEATSGETICDVMLANGIHIEHACEKSCHCSRGYRVAE